MTEPERCPTCKQRMPTDQRPVRTCADCQRPMSRHDKFTYRTVGLADGNIAQVLVHRHCDNPGSYRARGE